MFLWSNFPRGKLQDIHFQDSSKDGDIQCKGVLKNLGTTRTYCIAVFVIAFHSNVFVTYISSISSWWLFGNF